MAVVVYDVASHTSFVNSSKWVEDVRAERGSDVIIVLVGNKTDMSDARVVSTADGEKAAADHGILFIETSAKAGYNVKALFKKIAQALPGMDAPGVDANVIDIKVTPVANDQCSC